MKSQRTLATLFLLSLGIVAWAPIKKGYYPWPPMVMRTCTAYGLLSLVSIVSDEFAVLLASGFLLAQLVKVSSGTKAIPDWIYEDMTVDQVKGDTNPFNTFGLKFDGTTGVKE